MRRLATSHLAGLGLLTLVALCPAPATAAGFSIFEQGSKAMGMAGAFTAQADDGSAIFHNVAGLAFQRESSLEAGFTWITSTEAEFEGANPFPGEGVFREQETLSEFPPHVYYVRPLGANTTFGLGVNAPFGLTTEWKDPDTFPGRYLSYKAALRAIDITPSLGFKVGNFGLGIGAVARFSDVELRRRAGTVNPFTQTVVDVADVKLTSDFETGYGFNVGLLHKFNNSFSWGFTYRGKMKIEYAGEAEFRQISTGNPQLDAVIATRLPVGRSVPVETEIEFPDSASLGVAISVTPSVLVEVDANWTGWSTFDVLPLTFTEQPELSSLVPQEWEDCYNYRLGIRWDLSPVTQLRFGYVFDENPQPDTGVGPLLPDSDRNGFTVGYGHKGSRFSTDFALMYLPFDERTTSTNRDNYNGTYNQTAWLFGVTLGF
jgi:long-chain fatty acid transport protein